MSLTDSSCVPTADAFSVWMHVCLYAFARVQRVVYVYVCSGGQDSTAGVIPQSHQPSLVFALRQSPSTNEKLALLVRLVWPSQ